MAKDDKEPRYKEGRDYVMVDKGGYKTRKFPAKAEKEAAAKPAPKAKAKPAPKAKTSAKPAPKKEAPVAKDAMKGYRAGDVTTTKIGGTVGGRGDGRAERIRRLADKAVTKGEAVRNASSPMPPPRADAPKPKKRMTPKQTAALRATAPMAPPRADAPPSQKKNYTFADWQGMSRIERKRAGIPVSEAGMRLYLSGMKK